jgi:hypothetical protein
MQRSEAAALAASSSLNALGGADDPFGEASDPGGALSLSAEAARAAEQKRGRAEAVAAKLRDWRGHLRNGSPELLRGWLLWKEERLSDVYDELYKDDLQSIFGETFAKK